MQKSPTQPATFTHQSYLFGFPTFFKKSEAILLLAGVNLMLLNFILVQHFSVAIRQAEIAVLLFSLAYFCGISLGIILSDRLSPAFVNTVLPLFLWSQMAILIFSQSLVFILSDHLTETAMYVALFLIIMVCSTSLYSIFLPQAVDGEGATLKRAYSLEIAGSLIGLLLIPFLARISHECLLAGYFLSFLGIGLLLDLRKYILLIMTVSVIGFLTQFNKWDRSCAGWFYRHYYSTRDIREVIYAKYTPYHKIEVATFGDGDTMLILNGKRQFAQGSHHTYSYFVAEYPSKFFTSPQVGVLGCGSMSTVGRIGEHAAAITIVDLDEGVFKTSQRFFQQFNRLNELKNWTFKADDAKHYLANYPGKFDLILHDIPPGRSRQTALTYTAEFFSLVKEKLTPHGIFSIAALSVSDSNSDYGRMMLATLAHTFDNYFALEYDGSIYFYGGGRGLELLPADKLVQAIQHPDKGNVKLLQKSDIDELVSGEEIITINNVGDLIFG